MIRVNKEAEKEAIQNAIVECEKQARAAAESGQRYVTLRYHLPNYTSEVHNFMEEKYGIKCIERGFKSTKQPNGSYSYAVDCKIPE